MQAHFKSHLFPGFLILTEQKQQKTTFNVVFGACQDEGGLFHAC